MTVVERVRARAGDFARRPAIVEGERVTTYAALYERVDRLSAALAARGLRRGDGLLALLPNVREAVECELAALQSGLPWVTLNARLTWAEVRGVIATVRPTLIVTNTAGLEKIASGIRTFGLDAIPPLVVLGANGSAVAAGTLDDPIAYDALLAAHAPQRPDLPIEDHDVARLRYTSGTTGTAKAAVLPHRVYHASLDNLLHELHELSEADRVLHVAPLTHATGALVYPTLWAGGANVLMLQFDVEDVLDAIETHRITTVFTVPTMLSRLLASPTFSERDLSSLRSLFYGGAPMPAQQLRTAVEKIGHALVHIYGMTEAPWPITTLPQSEHRLDNPHLRSIGRPTTVCEVRVVDEADNVLGVDEIGELQIRGRNVMSGYYHDEEATRAVLRDGWLSSGDLGRRDADGYFYIVDRKKDVIISGGFNVYAKEVEMALCEDDRILEAAVVGLPNADWGELVAAFVVPKPGVSLTSADVERFARSRLSAYKCPRRVQVVDELPKSSTGKLLKPEIVRRFADETV
jgi:long-chain acyl-CoA synthetase